MTYRRCCALLALLTVAACGHETPRARTPAPSSAVATGQRPQSSGRSDQTVNLSSDLRKICGIDDGDRAPKFDFDSTQLSGNDREVLTKLAACLTTGPLHGRSIKLVGRADPRGEPEYNMNLGEARAGSVKTYLQRLGVASNHLAETSRGALDAAGHDEDTWRRDRRVDVTLD